MQAPPRKQILEWTESDVTRYLKYLVDEEVKLLEEGGRTTHVYHPFEPHKTQEIIAGVNAAIDTFEDIAEALIGEGMLNEGSEDEDEE